MKLAFTAIGLILYLACTGAPEDPVTHLQAISLIAWVAILFIGYAVIDRIAAKREAR